VLAVFVEAEEDRVEDGQPGHRDRTGLRARAQTDRYGDLAEAGRARRRAMSWTIDHLTMAS
jgi:hypothetical protein